MRINSFVVSIQRPMRSESVAEFIEKSKLNQETQVIGFDFRQFTNEDVERRFPEFSFEKFYKRHLRKPSMAEIGCLYSHAQIYRLICRNKFQSSLILEDDASLPFDFLEKVRIIVDYLEVTHVPTIVTLFASSYLKSPTGKLELNPEIVLFPLLNIPELTMAYMINLQAAEQLNMNYRTVDTVADWPNAALGVKFYYCDIGLKVDSQSTSTIRLADSGDSHRWNLSSSCIGAVFSSIKLAIREFRSFRSEHFGKWRSFKISLFNFLVRAKNAIL